MTTIEAELKLRLADPACLTSILETPLLQEMSSQPPCKQTLETTYYDTPDQSLLKSRLSYRLRLSDGEWVATVKADGTSDGGLHQRAEFNVPVNNPLPEIAPFLTTEIGTRLSEAVGDFPLEPVFSTKFDRHIMNLITPDGSVIELAIDDGEIIAGDKRQAILELELELKAGQPQSLIWLGALLAAEFPLLPERDSKLYRATLLAGLADGLASDTPLPSPVKKISTAFPARQVLCQTMIFYIHEAIRAQQSFLSAPNDTGTLQELQNMLQKIYALLEFTQPLLPLEEYLRWQKELTAWDTQLSHIRDFAIFQHAWDELTEYTAQTIPSTPGKQVLTSLLAGKSETIRTNFYAKAASGQLTPVFLGLWSYLQTYADQSLDDNILFKEFSRDRLAEWLTQFLDQGSNLTLTNPELVQQIDLSGKRLQYILEALAAALPHSTELLAARLEKLQEVLSSIQNITLTPTFLHEVVKASASRLTHRDAGLITGWQLAQSAAAKSGWKKAWSKITKAASKQKKLKPLDEYALKMRSPEI